MERNDTKYVLPFDIPNDVMTDSNFRTVAISSSSLSLKPPS